MNRIIISFGRAYGKKYFLSVYRAALIEGFTHKQALQKAIAARRLNAPGLTSGNGAAMPENLSTP